MSFSSSGVSWESFQLKCLRNASRSSGLAVGSSFWISSSSWISRSILLWMGDGWLGPLDYLVPFGGTRSFCLGTGCLTSLGVRLCR